MNWLKLLIRLIWSCRQDGKLSSLAQPWPQRSGKTATLIVAPHPDDESLGCGRLAASRCSKGEPVHIAILTDGGASHPGHPSLDRELLVRMRREEALQAAGCLGIPRQHVHFLNLPDGQLPNLDENSKEVFQQRLDDLFTLEPFDQIFVVWRYDISSEHEAAFQLLAGKIPPKARLLEYPVWARWTPWKLAPQKSGCSIYEMKEIGFDAAKENALKCYRSQFLPVPPWKKTALPQGFFSLFKYSREFFFEARPES